MIEPKFSTKKDVDEASYGRFSIEPLEQGYGHTLGNSLRRVLLTSLKGVAVTKVKIEGVRHPFSTLPGLKEDVIQLLLNIKAFCFYHLAHCLHSNQQFFNNIKSHSFRKFRGNIRQLGKAFWADIAGVQYI